MLGEVRSPAEASPLRERKIFEASSFGASVYPSSQGACTLNARSLAGNGAGGEDATDEGTMAMVTGKY